MLEAFLWWIGGCFTAWILIKIIGVIPALSIQSDAYEKVIRLTYNQYIMARNAVVMRSQFLLDNNLFTLEEVNAKLQADMLELENWAEDMVQIVVEQAAAGDFPFELAFNDWKSAKAHIDNLLGKRE